MTRSMRAAQNVVKGKGQINKMASVLNSWSRDDLRGGRRLPTMTRSQHAARANPATGKHVLADEEFGLPPADMTDEVKHPEASWLKAIGVGLDDFVELVAPGVF